MVAKDLNDRHKGFLKTKLPVQKVRSLSLESMRCAHKQRLHQHFDRINFCFESQSIVEIIARQFSFRY